MKGLTERQQKIMDFIRCQRAKGFDVTVRQIAAHMGISSPNGAQTHLRYLAKKGMVWRDDDGRLVAA